MADRLAEIKKHWREWGYVYTDDAEWLISEVERLRALLPVENGGYSLGCFEPQAVKDERNKEATRG